MNILEYIAQSITTDPNLNYHNLLEARWKTVSHNKVEPPKKGSTPGQSFPRGKRSRGLNIPMDIIRSQKPKAPPLKGLMNKQASPAKASPAKASPKKDFPLDIASRPVADKKEPEKQLTLPFDREEKSPEPTSVESPVFTVINYRDKAGKPRQAAKGPEGYSGKAVSLSMERFGPEFEAENVIERVKLGEQIGKSKGETVYNFRRIPKERKPSARNVISVQAQFPNGIPKFETAQGYKLRKQIKALPVAIVNGKEYTISLSDVSLPYEMRKITGGNTKSSETSGDVKRSFKEISDFQLRRILSAFKMFKAQNIDFDIVATGSKVVGIRFKTSPLSELGEVSLPDLLSKVLSKMPELAEGYYSRDWKGKFVSAFADLATSPKVEVGIFPDFSRTAYAILSQDRPNSVLILQPEDTGAARGGMGYLMRRVIEFPAGSRSPETVKMPWDRAIQYFRENISRLAPDWEERNKSPLLALRAYLNGNYKHKRPDGTEIPRQGIVIPRHAENSVAFLKAYALSNQNLSKFMKAAGDIPSDLMERRELYRIAKILSRDFRHVFG